jgi:hypothetical protein
MGFGFRMGGSAMRVSVSSRGVRTSIGKRGSSVSFGGGYTQALELEDQQAAVDHVLVPVAVRQWFPHRIGRVTGVYVVGGSTSPAAAASAAGPGGGPGIQAWNSARPVSVTR